jgi:hypothetical protein
MDSKLLNLDEVNSTVRDRVRDAFVAGDAAEFTVYVENEKLLALVYDNFSALKRRGIFEACLLYAFTGTRQNHHNWPLSTIEMLFKIADKTKLLAASDPLPDGDSFTVYRGVAGERSRRKLNGYSWTTSMPRACWFASRFGLRDPAVYEATVKRGGILACYSGRGEAEIVCRPRRRQRMPLTAEQIAIEAAMVQSEMKKELLEEIKGVPPVA